MPQLTESVAEQLSPEQAAELVRILDVHATWDNHRNDPTKSVASHTDLHARQKLFDAFLAAWRGHTAKNPGVSLPEASQNMPDRMAVWCRVLRVVFQRANGSSRQVMAKVFRLADIVAAKLSEEPVVRTPGENLADAVRELDVVIAWCEKFAKPPAPLSTQMKIHRPVAA